MYLDSHKLTEVARNTGANIASARTYHKRINVTNSKTTLHQNSAKSYFNWRILNLCKGLLKSSGTKDGGMLPEIINCKKQEEMKKQGRPDRKYAFSSSLVMSGIEV